MPLQLQSIGVARAKSLLKATLLIFFIKIVVLIALSFTASILLAQQTTPQIDEVQESISPSESAQKPEDDCLKTAGLDCIVCIPICAIDASGVACATCLVACLASPV